MSQTREVTYPGKPIDNIDGIQLDAVDADAAKQFPNASCHIVPVIFDQNGDALVQLNSISFRDGKLKGTAGGTIEADESIKQAGLREAHEENPALPINDKLTNFGWELDVLDKVTQKPKFVTFSVASFDTTKTYSQDELNLILQRHNASDEAAAGLLKLFEENKLDTLSQKMESYQKAAQEAKNEFPVLPLDYLANCKNKLEAFQRDPLEQNKKAALEEIRIKTEFNRRGFIPLKTLQEACTLQLAIDQKIVENIEKPKFTVFAANDTAGKAFPLFGGNVETIGGFINSEKFIQALNLAQKSVLQSTAKVAHLVGQVTTSPVISRPKSPANESQQPGPKQSLKLS